MQCSYIITCSTISLFGLTANHPKCHHKLIVVVQADLCPEVPTSVLPPLTEGPKMISVGDGISDSQRDIGKRLLDRILVVTKTAVPYHAGHDRSLSSTMCAYMYMEGYQPLFTSVMHTCCWHQHFMILLCTSLFGQLLAVSDG